MEKIILTQSQKNFLDGMIACAEKERDNMYVFKRPIQKVIDILNNNGDENKHISRPSTTKYIREFISMEILEKLQKTRGIRVSFLINLEEKEIVVKEQHIAKIAKNGEEKEKIQPLPFPKTLTLTSTGDILSLIEKQLTFHKEQVLKKEEELKRFKTEADILEKALSCLKDVLPIISGIEH